MVSNQLRFIYSWTAAIIQSFYHDQLFLHTFRRFAFVAVHSLNVELHEVDLYTKGLRNMVCDNKYRRYKRFIGRTDEWYPSHSKPSTYSEAASPSDPCVGLCALK